MENGGANHPFQLSLLDHKLSHLAEQFHTAVSVDQLDEIVAEIDSSTNLIDQELHHFTTLKLKRLQQDTSNIELGRTKLSSAIASSGELSLLLSAADDLGNTLTFKIRSLDKEIGNVNKTLALVEDLQLLKNNINQAYYAIETKNWELAAHCIHTINTSIDEKVITGQFSSVVIPSTDIPELPQKTISKWTKELTQVFQINFDEAARQRNVADVTRYFQLFPLIGQDKVGLDCYSRFICHIITDTLRNLLKSSTKDSSRPGLYATICMNLLENISVMLMQHGPLILKHYNATFTEPLSYVVAKIQGEIDSQVGLIADTFYDVRRFPKVIQDISLYTFPHLRHRQEPHHEPQFQDLADIVNLIEIGDLVNELATILHQWSLYCRFVAVKYFSTSTESPLVPEIIQKSNFTAKVTSKLLPAFESLCLFYFRRSLEKALTIEELPSLDPLLRATHVSVSPEQVPCSSVIEDITIVLNNTLQNVLDSAHPSAVKKFIGVCFEVIQRDLVNGFFIKSINENQPRYNSSLVLVTASDTSNVTSPGASRSGTPAPEGLGFFKGASSALGNVVGTGAVVTTASANPERLKNFVLYLNTVAVGQEYFNKIITKLADSSFLSKAFPFGSDNEKVASILKTDFLDPFNTISHKIIQDSLVNLYNQSFKSKLLVMVNECFPEVNETNYVVYSANILNDTSSLVRFASSWQATIRPYKQTFHKNLVYQKLVKLLVVNLANLLELKFLAVLRKFKINELGSLKLEKDLSSIINEVCEDSYELREKFVRVTQLVLLVGMDDEEYELSIKEGEDDGINWVLTPLERKQGRGYRI
ncbi:hypothetical protein QFC19_002151 [Naganishia cerealis]|uniref:Uncharacterized protein n=1 Tax=Naganishia cerealis TaxID=610337 RepID=A0ACC2WDI4_9TREE|nr:hypothetical protein QFC19_002151 [Naganishia cerealis]